MAWFVSMVHRFSFSSGVQVSLFCLAIAFTIGLVGLPWVIRKLAYEPHLLAVEDTRLVVQNQSSGEEKQFLFADIARYRVLTSKYGVALSFHYKDGRKESLGSNDFSLLEVWPAFSKAIRRYEQVHGEPAKFRPVSYFGHPVSTVILWLYVTLLVVLVRVVVQQSETSSATGFLWMLSLGFIAYVMGWYEAREERQNY